MVRPCLRAFASAVLDVTSAQSRLHTGWSVPACVPADLNRCLEPLAHGVVRPCLRARIGYNAAFNAAAVLNVAAAQSR